MKSIRILLLLTLLGNILHSQDYLEDCTITHKKGKIFNSSLKWVYDSFEMGTYYRNLTFDIKFDDNCKYVLTNTLNSSQQTRKQKVVNLSTDEWGKNSLRIGWCWNPDIEKIQLAFYSHINHDDDHPFGREFQLLNKNINTNQWVHVEMAIAKKGMFMSIDGQSILVSRNIYSWCPSSGESTFARANSYFEYKDSDNESQGAPHEMTFQVKNAVLDLANFPWGEKGSHNPIAKNLQIMNTNFKYSSQGTYDYYAMENITAPITPSSPSSQIETGQPYDIPYTVVEPDISVSFKAGESIHLKHGFHAKSGSHFRASICPPIKILSTPAEYEKPFCYTVENVTSAKLRVEFHVEETGNNYYIGSYNGIISGDQLCFDIDFFEDPFEYGYYTLEATFFNDCTQKKQTYYYDEIGKKTAPKKDSLSGSNPVIHFAKADSTFTLDKAVFRGDEFVIYPNPNTGLFNLSAPDNFRGKYSIKIYNSMGLPILQKKNLSAEVSSIDLSAYAKGVYFVKIITYDRILMRKVFLQ